MLNKAKSKKSWGYKHIDSGKSKCKRNEIVGGNKTVMTDSHTRKILFINSTLGSSVYRIQKREGKKHIF